MTLCTRNYNGTPSYADSARYNADIPYDEQGYNALYTYDSGDIWFNAVPGYNSEIPYNGCDAPKAHGRGYGFLPEKRRKKRDDDEVLFMCLLH